MHEIFTTWMFHYIKPRKDETFPYLNRFSLERFSNFLDQLEQAGPILTPDEFLRAIITKDFSSIPQKAQLLTFDDGLQDHYRWVFPELVKRGLSGLFFISTGAVDRGHLLKVHKVHALYGKKGYPWLLKEFCRLAEVMFNGSYDAFFGDSRSKKAYPYDDNSTAGFKYAINYLIPPDDVEKVIDHILSQSFNEKYLASEFYMSAEQIQEMNSTGMRFGFHGHTHKPFSQLSIDELGVEMDVSSEQMYDLLGDIPVVLSYPYGDASSITNEHVAHLKSRGIQAAFMAEHGVRSPNLLHLPRTDIAEWQIDPNILHTIKREELCQDLS